MSRYALLLPLLVLCFASAPVFAEPPFGDDPFGKDPIAPAIGGGNLPPQFAKRADVDVVVEPKKAKWGETVTVKLTITPKPEAHSWTYPAFPKDSGQLARNSIYLPKPGDLIFIGTVADPSSVKWEEKPRVGAMNGEQDQYTHKAVTWILKAVVSPKAKAGKATVAFTASSLQVCDKGTCILAVGKELPTATLEVIDAASDKVHPEDLAAALAVLTNQKAVVASGTLDRGPNGFTLPPSASSGPSGKSETRKVAKSADAYEAELKAITPTIVPAEESNEIGGSKQTGLWAFIATAAAWGLISLVTPCVFPMIPITVSIFIKQAEGSRSEKLKLAAVYCLTIISVLGVSAFALLKFMAWLSAHPVTNILLAVLFLVLALSLFGMYEITLPNSLQKRLQAKQAKGGVIGTIFGALAFTVISFTCVAPFLGGFAGISAGNDGGSLIVLPTAKEIAGGLAFATAFAAPFFVLALVPGLMKALPKSGGWLDSVKVVMGFLELAAALKFLRTAELRVFPTPQYFTYDVVLGGWVAISAACGLYLLNVFRLPHDEEKPHIGVPRLLFALAFLSLALYLSPGLLKGPDGKPQRPAGAVYAWVEAFLLPEATEEGWRTDLKDTIDAAKKSGKPIFVDFTGVTCTNCRYNEHNIFPQQAVRDELQQFEKVQLYTDEVPASLYATDPGKTIRKAEGSANRDFEIEVFKDSRLPLYAVVMPLPDGKVKVIGVYDEGKINDPARFATFLKESQEKAKPKK